MGQQGGDRQPEGASSQAEQQALAERRARQPPPAGAERGADPPLALPRRGPRQQQVGDVGTAQQQEEDRRRHQDAGGGEERIVGRLGIDRAHREHRDPALLPLAPGRRGVERVAGDVESGPGPLQAHSRSAPAEQGEPAALALLEALLADQPLGLRERDVERRRPPLRLKPRGHHADQGEGRAVEPQDAAHRLGVAAEHRLPEGVADHHHRLGAQPVVRRLQQPPELRPRVEEGEVLAVDLLPPGERHVAPDAHRGAEVADRHEIADRVLALLQVEVVEVGGDVARVLGGADVDPHRAVGVPRVQGRPEERHEIGEERRAGADPQRQRDDHRQADPGLAGQRAQSCAEGTFHLKGLRAEFRESLCGTSTDGQGLARTAATGIVTPW